MLDNWLSNTHFALSGVEYVPTKAAADHQLSLHSHYYSTIRLHRALTRRTPAQAYAARPTARPTATPSVRHDPIDATGRAACPSRCWSP